jgi:hypothetical protein
MPSEVRKLKQLEEKNTRLRKLVADLTLDKEMLTEVIKKRSDGYLRSWDGRLRPHLLLCIGTTRLPRGAGLSSKLSLPIHSPNQAVLRKRIRQIAETRARYGYRRVHVVL